LLRISSSERYRIIRATVTQDFFAK
jgi:hypothetical protein